MSLHPRIAAVTERIAARSRDTRAAYLARVDAAAQGGRRGRLGCANQAHAFAAAGPVDKARLVAGQVPNLAIVTAYNDMLSAHQPYERFPTLIRDAARAGGESDGPFGAPSPAPAGAGGEPPLRRGPLRGHTQHNRGGIYRGPHVAARREMPAEGMAAADRDAQGFGTGL